MSDKGNIMTAAEERSRIIVRTGITGIVANVMLAAFKATVGLLSNSIAVVLDAVNNLTDALSSLITIIGAKLAGKQPDRDHPYGHGRAEYISGMVVAAIVIYAGVTSLVESVKKIIHPEAPDYSAVSLIIIAAAIAVKLILSRYVKAQGKRANSSALIASGADAAFDAVLSASVLASAIVFIKTGLSLEAYVGAVISVIIIKSGIEMISDTLTDILGRRAAPELTGRIKEILNEEPEVRGAFDLIINNYGPDKNYASVHLELPDTMTVDQVDRLTRRVEAKVYKETGVVLTGVGVYSFNTGSDKAAKMQNEVRELVLSHDWALQLHGFYVDTETKEMRFDVVMSFDINYAEGREILYNEIKGKYPEYNIMVISDVDISDL